MKHRIFKRYSTRKRGGQHYWVGKKQFHARKRERNVHEMDIVEILQRIYRGEFKLVKPREDGIELIDELPKRTRKIRSKNLGSSVTSKLLNQARRKEIEEVKKKGGGELIMPLSKKELNKEMKFILERKDPPILRGKNTEEAFIIKKEIDMGHGKFIPKHIILKEAVIPLDEHRRLVNVYVADRKSAKEQFKRTGKFEEFKKHRVTDF